MNVKQPTVATEIVSVPTRRARTAVRVKAAILEMAWPAQIPTNVSMRVTTAVHMPNALTLQVPLHVSASLGFNGMTMSAKISTSAQKALTTAILTLPVRTVTMARSPANVKVVFMAAERNAAMLTNVCPRLIDAKAPVSALIVWDHMSVHALWATSIMEPVALTMMSAWTGNIIATPTLSAQT